MVNYNLASGDDIKKDYNNLDINDIDLNKSFVLKECDEVLMYHIFEHLNNPYFTLKEIHRNLNNGGILKVKLPTYACNIFHKTFIHDDSYFDCQIGKNEGMIYDNDVKFKLIKSEYRSYDKKKNKKSKFIVFRFLDIFKRLYKFYKIITCTEVYFELEKINY